MPDRNPLDVRIGKLAEGLSDRTDALERLISEPNPPGYVRLSPAEQLANYLKIKSQPDGLLRMRESMGGPIPDDRVDYYVQRMERAMARQAPSMVLDEEAERMGYGQSPFGSDMLGREPDFGDLSVNQDTEEGF